ncbi:hypothetical protein BAY59_38295 [Prauserella coralliicola]|uniref:Uncharacterized protein n=1 Tax=Prauserella flavalba TaxID=1477506 RepID=A0A318LBN5_9PSEU|nr:hypothetical protein BAY59_38295 [Prauserella coralliicola]PXY16879.1 hypothetical protein BA062_38275 [Prauserella flavalba]
MKRRALVAVADTAFRVGAEAAMIVAVTMVTVGRRVDRAVSQLGHSSQRTVTRQEIPPKSLVDDQGAP